MKNSRRFLMALQLIIGAFMVSTSAQHGKMNIAVNDLVGKGIDDATASIVSDRLRAELINTGVFRVMERSEMESILKEQGFHKSGACDEASCLVEVGQLLGVDRMLAGSVGNVGGFWTISVRMINVATAEILFTASEDYEGDAKGVISQATARLAIKIATGAGGELRKSMMAGKKGDLYIQTSQSGALIEIDGKAIDSLAPLTLKGYAAGEHRIVARKEGWYGSQTVTLNPDDLLRVTIGMEKSRGSVKVFSTPVGALIYVDGKECGETPIKLDELVVGQHEILVTKNNYISQKQLVRITMDETQNVNFTLSIAALLKMSVEPTDATILINGEEQQPNQSIYTVPAGQVLVQVEAPNYDTCRKNLTLAAGEQKQLDVKLESVFGSLRVETKPNGAAVFLNEQIAGHTPYVNQKIMPGLYRLRIEKATYEPVKTELTIIKGRETIESGAENLIFKTNPGEFELRHTKAYFDSVSAVKKCKQWVRRIIFGTIAAASGGTGLYFNYEMQQSVDRQNQQQAEYRAASTNFDSYQKAYQAEAKKISQYEPCRDVLYGVSIIFSCGFLISIPF